MEAHMGDTPTNRVNISELPESKAMALLVNIRETRMKFYKQYAQVQEEKLQGKLDKVKENIEKV